MTEGGQRIITRSSGWRSIYGRVAQNYVELFFGHSWSLVTPLGHFLLRVNTSPSSVVRISVRTMDITQTAEKLPHPNRYKTGAIRTKTGMRLDSNW